MTYQIQGFQGSTQNGYDAERSAETLKDARKQAKYMLSDTYRQASEASEKITTVQIWRNGELIDEVGAI